MRTSTYGTTHIRDTEDTGVPYEVGRHERPEGGGYITIAGFTFHGHDRAGALALADALERAARDLTEVLDR